MKIPAFIKGSLAPTFTAFNEDGSFAPRGQRNLLDFMLQSGGVSAFFIRSGLGQMYTFGVEDTKELIQTTCQHLRGKAPVMAGCSGVWDRNYDKPPDPETFQAQAVELSQFAQEQGVDAVVHTMPEALAPAGGQDMDGLILSFFERICAAVQIPVFIYQPPKTREEYHVNPERLAKLAAIDNLMGIKVSSSDAALHFDLLRAVRGMDFAYIVGAETAFYAGVMAGSEACIGQGTTVNPQTINAIRDRYHQGDIEGALQAQEDTNQLVYACPNPVDFFKTYATEKGFPVGLSARSMADNPYLDDRNPMTKPAYETYKAFFEDTIQRYR